MKTTSEAAMEYADRANPKIMRTPDINDNVDRFSAFKAGAEFAQRWILIEEELPPFHVWLNVKKSDYCATTKISGKIDLKFLKSTFTHWRPIELN